MYYKRHVVFWTRVRIETFETCSHDLVMTARHAAYSPNLAPIDESSPLLNNDAIGRVSPSMRREHLNADCKHLVPIDSPVIITGSFTDLHPIRNHFQSKSWIFRTFWSSKKRKGFSIIGIICCGFLIAASGFYLLRPRIRSTSWYGKVLNQNWVFLTEEAYLGKQNHVFVAILIPEMRMRKLSYTYAFESNNNVRDE